MSIAYRHSRWFRAGLAVLAGVLTGLAWEPYGLWGLLFIGLPAFTLLVRDSTSVRDGTPASRPRRQAFAIGYLFGLGLLTISINWVQVLGIWVAVLLIVFEALFFGLLGLTLYLTSPLRWWPLAAALCWSLIEFVYSRVPFGGFGWVRLAYAAVDTPLAGFLPLIGVAGVSFLVALIGQLVAYAATILFHHRSSLRQAIRSLAPYAAGTAAIILLGVMLPLVPLTTSQTDGTLQVGIVQGNVPGKGIEALGRMRSVTNNHLSETINLMVKARLGLVPMPDFILWPENSTDIDPSRDPVTERTVQAAAAIAGMPILVGAVMNGPGPDERQTAALWWDPTVGVADRYNKQNLVPFGEWIPFRSQLLPLVPILAQVGAQSVAGTTPGVLKVSVNGQPIKVGDIICFELAYDSTVYSTVTNGAQVLMVQSNNATYSGTGQIEQQFAITRARAMETRREIAVATTNSVSGFIDSSGAIVHRTDELTAASMVVPMPLRSGITPAVVAAPWIDRGLALAAVVACLLGFFTLTRQMASSGQGPQARQSRLTEATIPVRQDEHAATDVDPEAARQ